MAAEAAGTKTRQLGEWQGEFGKAYTERNAVDWQQRVDGWRTMVDGLEVRRVLEVGCNRGHNLVALSHVFGEGVELAGIEPNPYALGIARAASPRVGALSGDIFDLPFKDGFFDLVFTVGVLIHIALPDLPKALAELHRVSRRYLLAAEYFAEEETVIDYRGHDDLLWKRDFLRHYRQQFPGLKLVRSGYLEGAWDRTTYWLLEKPAR